LLAQQVHTTPYVLLVAAFNFLLTHHTNQFDITIGSGMAGRHYPELEKLIGFFVNTVVLRTDLNGNPTWIELIKRVHTTCVEAHQYQDVPFEMIVDALQLEREGNKNPIFQILFIMQKTGNDVNLNLQSLKCEDIVINKETSTFDITFNIALNTSALFGDIQYNSTIFSREKIEKLLADFQAILKIMVSQPTQPIQSSKIINQQDFDIIMRHWNKTTKNYAHNQIHQLFEMQTKLSPSKIALFYKDENITYQELNKRANQLANYINKKVNVKNKSLATIIGISVERSIDYVISMFAILKVGGIFLPLDPDYPFERLKYYINHSDLDFIICKSNNPHLKELEVLSSLILLDQESQAIANENVVNSELKMNELCYIMYTSGSTGAPKGIMIKHTSVANLLFSMQEILCFSHADRFLSVTSINFDIFYLELLLPLISGATCILADQYSIKDTNLFLNLITSTSPTWIQATPSFWSSIINLINESCINIKILTGGEPLTSPLSENLLNKFKEIWNVYGPTETTIWSTIKKIDGSKDISLGRPIANTKCYVLNEYHNPVPMNVIGELYIAGKGLAQGYVNDSEATAYSFIHNPFVDSNNHAYKIMYKTGDLVCYQPNGELQFMGRNDQQVKIRGFRVELLEIEYQILKIDGIREAVVIKNDGTFEKESLVAFYTTKSSLAINGKMIQTHLAKTLPYYMIPSKLVHLPEIPKTLNNKTDRNKLLVLNLDSHLYDDSAFISPRTELEHQLLAIWGAVLNIDTSKISLDDSFFMLGGHSLLIPQVVIKINKQLTTNITIRDFIQNSTIDKLAQVIKEIQKISTNEVA
ncbi:MAG TPA: amino acid adenylation domain-containing protein, partial [Gammaproteobacteria bacterium]|nr:amino acid adenylation domain-containing protein [Gammaproteobacteria bacterium]